MKITITVPDKLFRRDIETRFGDFWERVIADIADGLNNENVGLCGRYELETAALLKNAFAKGAYEDDTEPASWSPQMLFDDGFGGGRVGYICPHCRQQVPYAGKYCGKCGRRVYGGEE